MTSRLSAIAFAALSALPCAGMAAIVQNGSFENPLGTWANTGFNYMAVAAGSSAISGWAVIQANPRGVAWAQNPTNDGYSASQGAFFVDLSGFGTEAGPASRLEQTLQNLIAGETYTVGVDYWGDRATLSINGLQLAAAGAASGGWTHLSGAFQAAGAQALLSVGYIGASGVAFVDNVTVAGREAGGGTVPEPASVALALTALAALRLGRRGAAAAARRARPSRRPAPTPAPARTAASSPGP